MQFLSLAGLVVLLGLAWALSYHPRQVRVRTVIWGLALQFVFALIILKEDNWSFVGMVALAALLVVYIMQEEQNKVLAGVKGVAAVLVISAGVGSLAGFLASDALGWLIGVALIVGAVGRRVGLPQSIRRVCGALVVVFGTAWLIVNGVHGQTIFAGFSEKAADFLALSDYGARFLFGNLADGQYYFVGADSAWPGFGFQFAFKVLPTIIFFGGFMGVLYYLGIMQVVIEALARFMRWTVGTSGAETLSCTANVFVGQTEAPLLIKPFLDDMTRSELLTIMVGGFATEARTVEHDLDVDLAGGVVDEAHSENSASMSSSVISANGDSASSIPTSFALASISPSTRSISPDALRTRNRTNPREDRSSKINTRMSRCPTMEMWMLSLRPSWKRIENSFSPISFARPSVAATLPAVSDARDVVSTWSISPAPAICWPFLSTRKTIFALASMRSRLRSCEIRSNSSSYRTMLAATCTHSS